MENNEKLLIFNLYLNKFKVNKQKIFQNQQQSKCLYSVRNQPEKKFDLSHSTSFQD